MNKIIKFLPVLFVAFLLTGCFYPEVSAAPSNPGNPQIEPTELPQSTSNMNDQGNLGEGIITEPTPVPKKILPIIPPTPDPAPDLYGCEMRIEFYSGPLQNEISEFEVLDETYFLDKGDQFAVGRGTGVYYESEPYLILHSSYVNGNALKPMEAEFIRKYLEHWGKNGNEYIQEQMDSLIGSQVNWYCNDELFLETTIDSIARLSHVASERLWLEPTELNSILDDREGLVSEWIGEIKPSDDPNLYLGFCGWGPADLEYGRYTYFRYLLNFTIQNP